MLSKNVTARKDLCDICTMSGEEAVLAMSTRSSTFKTRSLYKKGNILRVSLNTKETKKMSNEMLNKTVFFFLSLTVFLFKNSPELVALILPAF